MADATRKKSGKTYTTTLIRDGSMCVIAVPFDPGEVFGRARPPVKVTVRGYTYRSTIALMGGPPFIPLRKSHREAAGLVGDETLRVRLELDTDPREIEPPADLARVLKATPGAWAHWQDLSFTHKREYVEAIEGAKKAETRARRIASAVSAIAAKPKRKTRAVGKKASGARRLK